MNTDTFKFSRQIGLVFVRRIGKFEARLCRECALAIGREYQSRTLSTGWWGVISFFTNVGYVFSNASELNRADRLMSPKSVPGYRSRPLDPGATVFTRPISWIGPAIIGILIALVIATGSSQTQGGSYDPDSGLNLDTPNRWAVGNCVVGLSSFTPVPCSEPHTGKIVSRVYSQLSCPSRTESFVSYNGSIFCIDEDA